MIKPRWMPKFIFKLFLKVLKIDSTDFKFKHNKKKANNITSVKSDYLPSINIKVEDLPSKGLFYPSDASIKYYPYTFEEVKLFSQSKMESKDRFDFVLTGIETNFDKYKLTVSDFMYLGILRNISTLETKKLSITYYCSSCEKENNIVEEINNFDFDELNDIKVPYIKEFSFGKYEFMPLTVEMTMELIDQNLYNDEFAIASIQTIMDLSDKGASEKFIDTYNKFKYAKLEDGVVFEEIIKDLYHSISSKKFICAECKASNIVSIDGGGDGDIFISPFREPSESNSTGIRTINEKYSANI